MFLYLESSGSFANSTFLVLHYDALVTSERMDEWNKSDPLSSGINGSL